MSSTSDYDNGRAEEEEDAMPVAAETQDKASTDTSTEVSDNGSTTAAPPIASFIPSIGEGGIGGSATTDANEPVSSVITGVNYNPSLVVGPTLTTTSFLPQIRSMAKADSGVEPKLGSLEFSVSAQDTDTLKCAEEDSPEIADVARALGPLKMYVAPDVQSHADPSEDFIRSMASLGKEHKNKTKQGKAKLKATNDTGGLVKPRKKRKQQGDGEDQSVRGASNSLKGKLKKEKRPKGSSTPIGSNPHRRLPTASSRESSKKKKELESGTRPGSLAAPGYSAQQAAVNDMMRRALEEDQYSALGSVVDTDSSSEDEGGINSSVVLLRRNGLPESKMKMDRNFILSSAKKHIRVEGLKSVHNFDGSSFLEEADDYCGRVQSNLFGNCNSTRSLSPRLNSDVETGEEDVINDGKRLGKRKKKKKKNKRVSDDAAMSESGEDEICGDVAEVHGGMDSSGIVDNVVDSGDEEDNSIFGQTAGSSNATWVECDRCKKWRRLRGVVDARKLPSKWYCSMNKNDPEWSKCSSPEEEYDATSTPESVMDQRARKHLRLWVRRLHCNESYENRQTRANGGFKKRVAVSLKEPYEWIRCCNPSCGKWRMLLRSMDASTVVAQFSNKEFYCVMNTWDEKAASCGASQENLPIIGRPPWVMMDDD